MYNEAGGSILTEADTRVPLSETDRKPYDDKAAADKKRYEEEKAAYLAKAEEEDPETVNETIRKKIREPLEKHKRPEAKDEVRLRGHLGGGRLGFTCF
jgi:hypothetical protein